MEIRRRGRIDGTPAVEQLHARNKDGAWRKKRADGYVEHEDGRPRKNYEAHEEGLGGRSLEAILNEDSSFSLAAELLNSRSGRRRYVLEAKGDSMIGAGIEEGDKLLVEENEDPWLLAPVFSIY